MSIEAIAAALRIKTGNCQTKTILILLANRHNADTGECFPSLTNLAWEAEISVRQVQRHLQALADAGLIAIRERLRENGSQTSNQYDLLFLGDRGGVTHDRGGVSPMTGGGCHPCHPHNRKVNQSSSKRKTTPHEGWRPTDADIEAIKAEFPLATDDEIESTIRSFISWTNAKGVAYVHLDHAWRSSARRELGKPLARLPGANAKGAGSVRGSLSGAIRRLAGDG